MSTTPPSSPDIQAPLQVEPAVNSAAQLDRISANVKALQQNALATQKSLEQIQAGSYERPQVVPITAQQNALATEKSLAQVQTRSFEQPPDVPPTGDGQGPWMPGVWIVVALLVVIASVRIWYRRPVPAAPQEPNEGYGTNYSSLFMGEMTAPAWLQTNTSSAGVEPVQHDEAQESDWGVSQSREGNSVLEFDKHAAASEVAKVREALARRRAMRDQQRAADARHMRRMAEQALCAWETQPGWDDSRPLPEVLDVTSDEDVALAARTSAPAPFWHKPSRPAPLGADDPQTMPAMDSVDLNSSECETQQDELMAPDVLLPLDEDVYAVKLDLARENAAVELWDEARELAQEVLAAGEGPLYEQAQGLLTQIDYQEDAMRKKAL